MSTKKTDLLSLVQDNYTSKGDDTIDGGITGYLNLCAEDKLAYANSYERMLAAFGEAEVIDTSADPKLSRIYSNRKIKKWSSFSDFFGMEETVEKIYSYFKHAAQGLEESKQILYLLGPVGGGKSSLAEHLKSLMEKFPIYTIKMKNATTGRWEISPVNESPLSVLGKEYADILSTEYGIAPRYLKPIKSPWLVKRLEECGGKIDEDSIQVIKRWPSQLNQIAVAKCEPGDENNQDISTLVGSVNIRMLEDFDQDDVDAYSFNAGLPLGNRGVMEFVEMFKAPIKMLHPLLTATQEGNYNGTRGFGAIPFDGIILAHSNESEWETFKNDRKNEAFLDRVCMIKVPYCLRISEEVKIYQKLLKSSALADAVIAPGTLEMMAEWSIMTRLYDPENSSKFSKMRVYDGQNIKEEDPRAKSIQEYRDAAGPTEGMSGQSTRFAYKILSKVFNFDSEETIPAANPIHLMFVLENQITQEQFPEDKAEHYLEIIHANLAPRHAKFLGEEIQKAYLESYDDYGQNMFDRYLVYADNWLNDQDYRDPNTGEMYDRAALNAELEKIEKSAGISNPKDFRNDVVSYSWRMQAQNGGEPIKWNTYEKMKKVIESRMFSNTEELLPVITFGAKASKEEKDKHDDFLSRMVDRGYTPRQVQLGIEWQQRYNKT